MSYVPSDEEKIQLYEYQEAVYNEATAKLQNGAKRIIITMPAGSGMTLLLLRIAND